MDAHKFAPIRLALGGHVKSELGAIFFHRFDTDYELSDDEIERLNDQLRVVLSEFGMTLEQYELASYHQDQPFAKCSRCGLLTAGFPMSELNEGGAIESFIKQSAVQGAQINGGVLCNECQAT